MTTLLMALFAGLSEPVVAQNAPQSRPLTVMFSGVVTNDVSDTIMIRQPDGSFAHYAGPVPQYAYRNGDNVSISFTTAVPTSAYYSQNPSVPRATDGIYRFAVQGPQAGSSTPFGVARASDISGPFSPTFDFGIGGITIVYDSNADTYSLEFPNGSWGNGYYAGPSYTYDAQTGALMPAARDCFYAGCGDGAFVRGTADTARITVPVGDANEPSQIGSFWLALTGMFNVPTYNGGPAQVPEPGSMLLFGGGVAWLVRRQHRGKPTA